MTLARRMARDEALADALREADLAIGDEEATDQARRIVAAIKCLRDGRPTVAVTERPIDYLEQVQQAAQAAWWDEHKTADRTGAEYDATAAVSTPVGRLAATTWRVGWRNGRVAWCSEYWLDDEPITVAEIRKVGLARRPTSRRRR